MSNPEEFRLPDTGQVKCYDREGKEIKPQPGDELYGQNGCFLINPMSFIKLDKDGAELPDTATWEDGLRMVLDNNTGLIWEVKSPNPDDVNYANDKYSWQDAQDVYVKKLNAQKHGGFDDWRIPNKDELRSIVDYGKITPAVDTWYFPDCQNDFYWCSATYEMQPYFGWVIFFGLGSATASSKTSLRHVRAVRGGVNPLLGKPDLHRFVDNGDGTITDNATGLMWQKGENARANWYKALKACENMELAGYDDWRLPNIKELNTILDTSRKDGWWYFKDFFPAEGLVPPLLHYFSSTVYQKTYAWVTNFNFGYDGYYADKNANLLFRAVRTITPPEEVEPQFKLPDTGQILCYDDEGNQIETPDKEAAFYGQDGVFSIFPMSFTKLREGGEVLDDEVTWEQGWRMVKDNNTGLVWEVKSQHLGDINYKTDRYSWHDAQVYIERLNKQDYGGFSDWRLPNREELRTIVNYADMIPAIDLAFFPSVLPDFYWSKDPYIPNPKLIWGIYFAFGCGICYLMDSPFLVRAVRGGYNPAFGDTPRYAFKDNGDGTVTDLNSGLMWKKDESPEMSFKEVLQYCEDLTLGGYDDWRLPNMKELPTLLDLSFENSTWFHRAFFPNVKTKPLGFYSCSSTFAGTFGWGVNFQFGYDGYYADKKHGRYPFRPVRSIK
jgi:hypothetical protein